MISPVLLKADVGCGNLLSYRSAVVEGVEEHYMILSGELQEARC